MIWLTWRQFRGQLLAALALLAAITIYLVFLGQSIRESYETDILGCLPTNGCVLSDARAQFLSEYQGMVELTSILLIAVPVVIGIFWGAPLITRELETNTNRLVWNQSVTRTRWLAVKLVIIGLASAAVTGALSLLLTWAASRYDQVAGDRFLPLSFASRNIVPLGYAAFAFALGTTVGLILRRTLPAMAASLIIIGVVQVLMPTVARPHLQTPVTETIAYTFERDVGLNIEGETENVKVTRINVPGALMVSSTAYLTTSSGGRATISQIQDCLPPQETDQEQSAQCIAERDLYIEISYQPANRYWSFQWRELAGYVVLTGLLSGFALWRIRRVRG